MPVGTERRIFGLFKVPFIKTFHPLRRTVEVHPHALPQRVEQIDDGSMAEAVYHPRALAHPVIREGEPTAILIEEEYCVGLTRIADPSLRPMHAFRNKEVNTAPRPLRMVKGKGWKDLLFPEVIVYKR